MGEFNGAGAGLEQARDRVNDIAGTIHDRIANIREGVRRRYRGDDGPHPVTRGEAVAEAEQVDELLAEFFGIIDDLIDGGQMTESQTSVDGLHRWNMRPQAASLVRSLEAEIEAEPTATSASNAAIASDGLKGALDRIDRYVKGIAKTLGRPVSDEPPDIE